MILAKKINYSTHTMLHIFNIFSSCRCCNTCEDVKEAYRLRRWALPDLSTIEQCKNDDSIERTNLALKEGCQLYGYMEVNRVKQKIYYNKL